MNHLKTIKILAFSCTMLMSFFISEAQQSTGKNKIVSVVLHPAQEYQTMDGFGASDSWRVQFVGKYWPIRKRKAMADLLFSLKTKANGQPEGIGLSIWRFYLGAGTTEQGDGSGIKNEWRRAECFELPDGNYDWSKMQGQRWLLKAAKKRGVNEFLAYSIAPSVQYSL